MEMLKFLKKLPALKSLPVTTLKIIDDYYEETWQNKYDFCVFTLKEDLESMSPSTCFEKHNQQVLRQARFWMDNCIVSFIRERYDSRGNFKPYAVRSFFKEDEDYSEYDLRSMCKVYRNRLRWTLKTQQHNVEFLTIIASTIIEHQNNLIKKLLKK